MTILNKLPAKEISFTRVSYEPNTIFSNMFIPFTLDSSIDIHQLILKTAWLDTPLGPMIAIADEEGLYLLEFIDRRGLENEIKCLGKKLNAAIIPGENHIIKTISLEINNYFVGKICVFKTPLYLIGSPFQKKVWHALTKIPPGETCSYLEVAKTINAPTACRAVARANGSNRLSIIIPCHRVINANGQLGGYGGGVARKQWLLEHESQFYKEFK